MELSFPFTLLFWLVDFPRPIKFNQSGAPHSKFKNQKKTDAILSGYHSGGKMFHVWCSNEIDTPFVANLVEKSGINTVTGTHKKNKLWEELFRPTFLLRPSQAEAVVMFHWLDSRAFESVLFRIFMFSKRLESLTNESNLLALLWAINQVHWYENFI